MVDFSKIIVEKNGRFKVVPFYGHHGKGEFQIFPANVICICSWDCVVETVKVPFLVSWSGRLVLIPDVDMYMYRGMFVGCEKRMFVTRIF